MNLDKGVCTVFRRRDVAQPGNMPAWAYENIYQSWYGEPEFATGPAWPTERRKENQTDARIRILQNRDIRQNDVVILRQVGSWAERQEDEAVFNIDRAYHGLDDDGPTPITDLTLREVRP